MNDETNSSKCRRVKEEVNAVTEPESNRRRKKKKLKKSLSPTPTHLAICETGIRMSSR